MLMSETAYKSQTPYHKKESSVLVICCSGYDFLPYTREFLEKHLGISEGSYDLLAVPGGAQFLLLTEYLPKFAWVGHRWVKFLVERHRLRKVIAISHEDCGWYKDDRLVPAFLQKFGVGPRSLKERQREDLREIAKSLQRVGLPIAIEAYYAENHPDGFVHFTKEV
jgi:hypothetical protein